MLSLVKQLCQLDGVSGWEDEVRDHIRQIACAHADEVRTDALGNLIVWKRGAKSTGTRFLLSAHMDEVGVIVSQITDSGYLRFQFVGGVDRRVCIGKRVRLGKHHVAGVIGIKPYHLVSRKEEKSVPRTDELYIDIGAKDRESAAKLVSLGDYGAFCGDPVEFGSGFLKAKAIDDRVGCAVMLKLLQERLPVDCTFAFTAQEEVGARGAFGAAFSVAPEIALILEGTTAADCSTAPEHRQVCWPGRGPVLSLVDGGAIYDRELFELLRRTAEEEQIPWQVKHYLSGGTDAQAIQRTKEGIRVCGISAAVRYLHTPSSVCAISDMDHMLTLARAFLVRCAQLPAQGRKG